MKSNVRCVLLCLIFVVSPNLFLTSDFSRPVAAAPSSSVQRKTRPPAVGEKARDFELDSLDGQKIKLSALAQRSPVVVVVLRGFPGYQ